jgi:hypothetical protein
MQRSTLVLLVLGLRLANCISLSQLLQQKYDVALYRTPIVFYLYIRLPNIP